MNKEKNYNDCRRLTSFTLPCPHKDRKALKTILKWLRNPVPSNYITPDMLKLADEICSTCTSFEPDDG